MATDPEAIVAGSPVMASYLREQGQHEEASRYLEKAWRRSEMLRIAREERSGASGEDEFSPHGLPAEAAEGICRQMEATGRVRKAFMACKAVKCFPESPFHVLVVVPRYRFLERRSRKLHTQIVDELCAKVSWPVDVHVMVAPGDRKLLRKLAAVDGARILG